MKKKNSLFQGLSTKTTETILTKITKNFVTESVRTNCDKTNAWWSVNCISTKTDTKKTDTNSFSLTQVKLRCHYLFTQKMVMIKESFPIILKHFLSNFACLHLRSKFFMLNGYKYLQHCKEYLSEFSEYLTEYLSVFGPNAGKCEPELLRTQTLFTQWNL